MLSDGEWLELCQRLVLSEAARTVIQEIRSSPPTRRVRSGAGNVAVHYPSRKMGVTIQAESHRNELAAVYEFEHDPEVREYYDQPPSIRLRYPAKNGRQLAVPHTPDYFVIRTDAVGWVECKMKEDLVRLAEKMPHRYIQGSDGAWRCPPGEEYAQQLGFSYWVRSSAQIDWPYQRNLRFLEDFLRADRPTVEEAAIETVLALVSDEPGIALDDLFSRAEGVSRDEIYSLIATERICVDLHLAPLAEPGRVRVFRDHDTAQAYAVMTTAPARPSEPAPRPVEVTPGTPIVWDGRPWTIANVGETTIAFLQEGAMVEVPIARFEALVGQGKLTGLPTLPPSGTGAAARDRFEKASQEDLREANRRHAIIAPYLAGHRPATDSTPGRTIRLWCAKFQEAERVYGSGYLGLLPRTGESGNRRRKLDEATLAVMHEFIVNKYESLPQKPVIAVYRMLVCELEARSIRPPSYKTFCREVKRRPRQEQVEKRMGRRAAYQFQPSFSGVEMTTPRHGDRPLEICHIDHTESDIELVDSRTGRNLGRPWATFLIDAFSRRLLAVYLTYDPPSYRSCMMVLRECVRRHNRLSQTLVVDGGREFESTYFETLLARYGVEKKTRPPAQGRAGAPVERVFGTANTQVIHTLTGNTQIMRNVRQVTKPVNPRTQACWTLPRLYECLCQWAYEIYDTTVHPALGETPRDAYLAGLDQGGKRLHRIIAFDDTFKMDTLPTTPKGTAKVDFRLGVKINNIHYFHNAFRDREVEKTQVPVRYDPFDAGVAHAYVKGRWVRCTSDQYASFAGRSEKEVMLATEELRRRNQHNAQQSLLTTRKVGAFLTSTQSEDLLLQQRLQDAEGRDVLRIIGGGLAAEDGPARSAPAGSPRHEAADCVDGDATSKAEAPALYGDYK